LLPDAVSSPPVEDGETLAPTVADVLISFVCIPASSAVTNVGETSLYARALTEHLRPGVDVTDALFEMNRQFPPDAKVAADVVSTLNRPLVFPHGDRH